MKFLWLRIYAALLAVLLVFTLGAGWLVSRQWTAERAQAQQHFDERLQAMAELLGASLPPPDAPADEQQAFLQRWGQQLRVPLALEAADGRRLAANARFERREAIGAAEGPFEHRYADGRRLLVLRPQRPGWRPGEAPDAGGGPAGRNALQLPPQLIGTGVPALLVLVVLLFAAVALAAWPVARKLTRRLEALRQGVQRFGDGDLAHRVPEQGRDEVAQVAAAFNQAATRVQQLVQSHRTLLANASHELRSPLARLRMALALRRDAPGEGATADKLDAEVERNLRELDALVDEVLLASRLDAGAQPLQRQPVDVLALAAELAAQHGVELEEPPPGLPDSVALDERLLRRALRNLLENALRYGRDGQSLALALVREGGATAAPVGLQFRVADHGPGVPEALRDRIFEPFFRLPGHAEVTGGVGLGLALVKQIAEAHGGQVQVQAREGGGSVFVLSLPLAAAD